MVFVVGNTFVNIIKVWIFVVVKKICFNISIGRKSTASETKGGNKGKPEVRILFAHIYRRWTLSTLPRETQV